MKMCRIQIRSWCVGALMLLSCAAKELTDIEMLASAPRKCSYERAYDMYGAHCADLRLDKIPNLRGGIEVLDFSQNRLKKLHANLFSGYSSIKFLYLAENLIFHVDDDAFSYLTSLQILDLSNNVITKLPATIFQLTSLRTLYLSKNPLVNLQETTALLSKPIKAPLELLDISNCELEELPDLGILPNLNLYNVSRNPLKEIEVKHFARACNLRKVDLSNSITNIRVCDLRPAITLFEENRISFTLEAEDYNKLNSKEFEKCPRDELTPLLNATLRQCRSEVMLVQNARAARRTWLTIGGGLAGFLVGFMALLYAVHRCNVAHAKHANNKQLPTHNTDKNATAILLNNAA